MNLDIAKIVPPPVFDSAKNFPPKEVPLYSHGTGITKETIVTKRFVFDSSSILALKNQAALTEMSSLNEHDVYFPTRIEAVSALIWKCVLALYRSKPKSAKICIAVHAVNIRERMEPSVPNYSFGNYWTAAIAPAAIRDNDITELVSKLHKSIKKINAEYVESLIKGGSDTDIGPQKAEKDVETTVKAFSKGELEVCNFTSWCKFPVYEVDFGWGKPSWVCSPIRSFKNLVILMETKDGDGIEASVNLLEEDMPVFQNDPEILAFASCP